MGLLLGLALKLTAEQIVGGFLLFLLGVVIGLGLVWGTIMSEGGISPWVWMFGMVVVVVCSFGLAASIGAAARRFLRPKS